jgi:biopolymer transport protein ExbB
MHRGGWVMWPLLVLSCAAAALVAERTWFWIRTNHRGRLSRFEQIMKLLHKRDTRGARALAEADDSIYGRATMRLMMEQVDDAAASDAVESQRPYLERFMPTLSTIITSAPLLGILGTVTGLIRSFNLLAEESGVADPRAVSPAIGEALLTTAVGLALSVVVLFPYNAFRAQVDRTLSRFEVLVNAAGRIGRGSSKLPGVQDRGAE